MIDVYGQTAAVQLLGELHRHYTLGITRHQNIINATINTLCG